MDTKTIETIMTGMGLKADADGILTLIQDHPTYSKMNEEHGPDDTVLAIAEDFPRLFESEQAMPTYGDQEHQGERKRSRYNPGKQKHNQNASAGFTGRDRGRQRAKDRHKKRTI